MSVDLTRFTSFDYAVGLGYLSVYVNPVQLAYVQPRRQYDTKLDRHLLNGTRLFFQQEAGVLDVREDIDEVLALLAGHDFDRELKIDLTYETARADLLP
ncbi:MAG TPA: hypothetical protein VGJ60_34105 [Chloroflexota bacterium]|jgi:hypothetical protein